MGLFEQEVYSRNWIFTIWADYPDWVKEIGNIILETIKNHSIHEKTNYRGKTMTYGQYMIFKIVEPANVSWTELKKFFPITKGNLKKLLTFIYDKTDSKTALWVMWLLQYTGFHVGTKAPASYSPQDFKIPDEILKKKQKIVKDLEDGKIDVETFENEMRDLAKELIEKYKVKGLTIADIIFSGAAKNEINNIQRMMLARGLSITSAGDVNAVVTTSLAQGVKPEDYIATSSESIQNLYSKSHFTASGGYTLRLLIDLLSTMKISQIDDCKSKNYLEILIDSSSLAKAVVNRYSNKGLIESAPKVGTKIKLRSPLYCLAPDGICSVCLGKHFEKLGLKKGDPLIITATSVGDALTAVALKRSHVGSSLNATPIDFEKEIFG